jgi:hypothetical protein
MEKGTKNLIHPHACGESDGLGRCALCPNGLPPRMWGKDLSLLLCIFLFLSTDMRLGNEFSFKLCRFLYRIWSRGDASPPELAFANGLTADGSHSASRWLPGMRRPYFAALSRSWYNVNKAAKKRSLAALQPEAMTAPTGSRIAAAPTTTPLQHDSPPAAKLRCGGLLFGKWIQERTQPDAGK